MASKAPVMNDDQKTGALKRQEPGAMSNFGGNVTGKWGEFTHFLDDVRAEMRKVVTPSRKEVESTTSVVIIAVFLFGMFFFLVDWIFRVGINEVLSKLSH